MRNFDIVDCEQRSPEWTAARLGRLTGSAANDMLATIKTGEAAARRNLRTRLVLERITGKSHESDFQSIDMMNGIAREPEAIAEYEISSGTPVFRHGFLQHINLMAGCSPDGVIGDFDGLLSVKCPKPATHLEFLETEAIPLEYLRQCCHELFITGAEWIDYVSFQPAFPEPLRSKMRRVFAKDLALDAYEGLVRKFLAEVDEKEAAVRKLIKKSEAA